jgi:rhombotail lipoprotein
VPQPEVPPRGLLAAGATTPAALLVRSTLLPLLLLPLLLAGCVGSTTHRAASVMDYLYPERTDVVVTPAVPELRLPLRVGIAFVPEVPADRHGPSAPLIPESERLALLDEIASHFRRQPYVAAIEVIPTAYLLPRGGFANLDQLRRMFGVDVVALVSYDQAQFTDPRRTSVAYWTLVGAYVVEGERNDTRTLLDAAVFDVASRTLLFRAPGVSAVRGGATPVNLAEEQRRDAERGFRLAAADLVANLERELERFEARARADTAQVRIVERRTGGGTGAGASDGWWLLGAGLLAGVAMAAGGGRRGRGAGRADGGQVRPRRGAGRRAGA